VNGVPQKTISVLTPCFNEEPGIRECYEAVRDYFDECVPDGYGLEHVFIDNASTDGTVAVLREIAAQDRRVKVIVNARNFGLSRSPYYGMLQVTGDAVVPLVADLQTPVECIGRFIEEWERGYLMVIAVRTGAKEGIFLRAARSIFYGLIKRMSHVQQIKNFIGFGLFDRRIIEILRTLDDPSPYFRGMVSEIGFDKAFVEYSQPERKHGRSRHSFFDLFDLAMLGITSYSRAPLRIMTLGGLLVAVVFFLVAVGYLVAKLLFWDWFTVGTAPILIGTFFLAAVQLFCLGLVGEYVGLIFEQVRHRPLVVEQERINFDENG
jgi:glycosyltransferase involved in cell wall biosynthesis